MLLVAAAGPDKDPERSAWRVEPGRSGSDGFCGLERWRGRPALTETLRLR